MNLQLDKAIAEKGRSLSDGEDMDEQVHKIVQESVGSGRIGNFKVDPQYLVFEPQSRKYCTVIQYYYIITKQLFRFSDHEFDSGFGQFHD